MKISILVPSYNQAAYIGRTIDSILRAGSTSEIIVMDAGSKDGTADVVRSYGERVKFVSERDKGQADALNKALKLATGDWIGWQNSDDTYTDGALEVFEQALVNDRRNNREADVYFGHANIIDADDRIGFVKYYTPFSLEDLVVNGFNLTNQSAFFRRTMVEHIGGWDMTLHHCMDLDFFIRLSKAGAKFRLVNRVLGSFRVHGDAKSSKLHDTRVKEWAIIIPREFPGRTVDDVLRSHSRQRLYWLSRRIAYLLLQGNIWSYAKFRYTAIKRNDPIGHPAVHYKS